MCVDFDFRLFSDLKAEEISFTHKKRFLQQLKRFFLKFPCRCSVIDGYRDKTDDNQRSQPDVKQSSIENFLKQKLGKGCIFQENHAIFAIFLVFLVRFFFDVEKQNFLNRKTIFPFLDILKVQRRFKILKHFPRHRKFIELQLCIPIKNTNFKVTNFLPRQYIEVFHISVAM